MEKKEKWKHLFKDDDEWEFFLKLGLALHDPREKRDFFDAVIQGKQRDPNFEITGYVPKPLSDKAALARKYVGPILETLRRGKKEESA